MNPVATEQKEKLMQRKPDFWRWVWDCLKPQSLIKALIEMNKALIEMNKALEFLCGLLFIGIGIGLPATLHAVTGQAWYLLLFGLIPLGLLIILHGWYRGFIQGK